MPNVATPTTIASWFTVTITPVASAASATGTRMSTRVISGLNAAAIPPPVTASARYSQRAAGPAAAQQRGDHEQAGRVGGEAGDAAPAVLPAAAAAS